MSWFGGKKKEKKHQFTGFPGDLSNQQEQALSIFKNHVKQKSKSVNNDSFDEIYMLRFLRARKFDIVKTVKMWDDFIDWRIKNNIDNYKNFKFPELPTLRKLYPHGYHKVDKNFRPIYIQRVGFMDVDKIFQVMATQNMLKYYTVLYQTLLTTIFSGCTKEKFTVTGQNGRVTQTVTILDLKHVKLGNAGKSYDFVKPVSAMAQNNYPEILGNMFIINAPMLFTAVWAIVKMWIDDKTKQKIKILGSSYKKELLELIDPQNLPAFIQGGLCKCDKNGQCKLQSNIGPWNPEGKQLFNENIQSYKNQIQKSFNDFNNEQKISSSKDQYQAPQKNEKQINQIRQQQSPNQQKIEQKMQIQRVQENQIQQKLQKNQIN